MPPAAQACSGFLVEWDGFRMVLDLGYGTAPHLLSHAPDGDVDAVVITPEHPDHCVDLHALFRVRLSGQHPSARIPLYCPPGVLTRLAGLEPDVDLADVFEHWPLPAAHDVGPFRLEALPLPHFVPTVGVRLETTNMVIAYATDSGPHASLAELGRDAYLYVLEATDRPGETEHRERNLLTAEEAGEWAERAAARRLVLTHLWSGTDSVGSISRARRTFTGPVHIARQGLILALDDLQTASHPTR